MMKFESIKMHLNVGKNQSTVRENLINETSRQFCLKSAVFQCVILKETTSLLLFSLNLTSVRYFKLKNIWDNCAKWFISPKHHTAPGESDWIRWIFLNGSLIHVVMRTIRLWSNDELDVHYWPNTSPYLPASQWCCLSARHKKVD